MNARAIASQVLLRILNNGTSLTTALTHIKVKPEDHALVQELCYGTLRWYYRLKFLADQLLSKPLKKSDHDIFILILVGIYQLLFTRVAPHAALSETVEAARQLKKNWATKLINGVLRQFQRQQSELLSLLVTSDEATYSHPTWLIKACQFAYPETWQTILTANNQQAPLTLRVNCQRISVKDYLEILAKTQIEATPCKFSLDGITLLNAMAVERLPGFTEGYFSVQDQAAQFAAQLLDAKSGEHVLDACAAPGGKTTHILERATGKIALIALDNDEQRLIRVKENLHRLGLVAQLECSDANVFAQTYTGPRFDKILLDAPCSATGVIRRHPDIKLLRRPSDIAELQAQQLTLLKNLWGLLNTNGALLYATCSILPEENSQVIKQFLAETPTAKELEINAGWGIKMSHGRQILPSEYLDGFYYARLGKK